MPFFEKASTSSRILWNDKTRFVVHADSSSFVLVDVDVGHILAEISIPMFEGFAKSRLKVLHMLERVSNPERPVGKDLDAGTVIIFCILSLNIDLSWSSFFYLHESVGIILHCDHSVWDLKNNH